MSQLDSNTVAQRILPGQETLQAAQTSAEEILAQLAQSSDSVQACVQH